MERSEMTPQRLREIIHALYEENFYSDMLRELEAHADQLERNGEALRLLRLQACQLGDFMYEPVRFCSQEMIRGIDELLKPPEAK